MTERKFMYYDETEEGPTESDPTTDTIALAGMSLTGDIAMGTNEVTGLPSTPSGDTAAASKAYVDGLISGIVWKDSAECLHLVGNLGFAAINALGIVAGNAYVVTDSGTLTRGSLAVVAGDLVEDNGTIWIKLSAASGGFVPAGTRAILSTSTALISPYTDATDDGKVVEFSGSSNTGVATGDAIDTNALLIQDDAHVGYYDNLGYVFEGTVPSGSWIQFTGAGTINAGAGLTKSGNTIAVGSGQGIQVNADSIEVDLETTNASLEFVGSSPDGELQVKVGGANGLVLGSTGVELEIDDSPDTLDVDADGLKVVGLPSQFKVNGTAVKTTVTQAAFDTLTDTSNADLLHSHTIPSVDASKRIEDVHVNNEIIAAGLVVRWSGTNNQISKADNATSKATARAIGIARVGGAADPGTSNVVKHGICAGCLSTATVNTPYYLGTAGALVLQASIPKPGRVVRMGYAANGADLDVQIMDFGQRRA